MNLNMKIPVNKLKKGTFKMNAPFSFY